MTPTQEAAMRQALEALQALRLNMPDCVLTRSLDKRIDNLSAALAEPVQEPIPLNDGRLWQYSDGSLGVGTTEPVWDASAPVVLHPHPAFQTSPPQRDPLTEKEMYIVEEEARKNFRMSQAGPRGQMITYWDSLTPWLIRATERAHVIGE